LLLVEDIKGVQCFHEVNKKRFALLHPTRNSFLPQANLEYSWFYDGIPSIVLDIKCISTKYVNVLG
jgi:hypothetical protein